MASDNTIPLVSVIVITYNSSKYVIETLESIKSQSYPNIELIVSDDSSQDDTVDKCREWIAENLAIFVNAELIISSDNTGISANCNRGVSKSNGNWIKLIAGDDILDIDCVKSFLDFANNYPKAMIIESVSQFFKGNYEKKNFFKVQNSGESPFFHAKTRAEQQYQLLLRRNYLHAPSVFIKRNLILDVGGFDEEYKYIEDHPLWLRATKKGYKIFFLHKITVYYRIHGSSVFASRGDGKLYNDFYIKRRPFDLKYIYPNISLLERLLQSFEFYQFRIFDRIGFNRNKRIFSILFYTTYKYGPCQQFLKHQIRKIEKQISNNC